MVFFSDKILLMVSILVFSSWVSVCVCVFVVHGTLSCCVWFGVSGFPEFSVSVTVSFFYVFAYIFISGFPVFQSQKTNLSLLLFEPGQRVFALLS